MAVYSKQLLSGSTAGKPILVSQTATPGTIMHTAHLTALDEIWLYCSNTSTTAIKLTIEFGGTTTAEQVEITVAGESGLTLIIPGLILSQGNIVRAFAATANALAISGYVNRIA